MSRLIKYLNEFSTTCVYTQGDHGIEVRHKQAPSDYPVVPDECLSTKGAVVRLLDLVATHHPGHDVRDVLRALGAVRAYIMEEMIDESICRGQCNEHG